MLKGLEIPSLITRTVYFGVLISLCFAQTVWANEGDEKTPKHSSTETKEVKATPGASEKIGSVLEKAPVPMLSELSKTLARGKQELSKEDFDKIIDDVIKSVSDDGGKDIVKAAEEAGDKLKKVFEEELDNLGEKPGAEINAAVTDELASRLNRPNPPGDSVKPPLTTDDDKKPSNDPRIDELKKQLADFQDTFKKSKEKLDKEKEEAKLKDLLRGLGDRGKGGSGGGSPSSDNGGSPSSNSGSGSPSDSDSGGEDSQKLPDTNQTAGDKLRALANLLANTSNDDSSTTPSSDDEEDPSPSKESSKEDKTTLGDLLADDKSSNLSDTTETPSTPPPTPQAEMPYQGPPAPPAKTALPMIANDGARKLPDAGSNQNLFSGPVSGSNSGSTGLSTSSSGFTDSVFNLMTDAIGMAKRITYKYVRTGSETYGSTNGDGPSSSSGGGGSTYTSSAGVGGASNELWTETTNPSVSRGLSHEEAKNVFVYLAQTVEDLCTKGSLDCSTSTEKQQ